MLEILHGLGSYKIETEGYDRKGYQLHSNMSKLIKKIYIYYFLSQHETVMHVNFLPARVPDEGVSGVSARSVFSLCLSSSSLNLSLTGLASGL